MADTNPWIMETIVKGSMKRGPLMVLKRVSETKAVWGSRMFLGSRRM